MAPQAGHCGGPGPKEYWRQMIRIISCLQGSQEKEEHPTAAHGLRTEACFCSSASWATLFLPHEHLERSQGGSKKDEDELKTYEKTIKSIAELEKKIKEIRAKLEVIRELEKNRPALSTFWTRLPWRSEREAVAEQHERKQRQPDSYRDGHGQ